MRFRKRPVVVDAWPVAALWGTTERAVPKLLRDAIDAGIIVGFDRAFGADIKTPEGTMRAAPGDYIIRGIKGEFYPCKPDIFAATRAHVRTARSPAGTTTATTSRTRTMDSE